MHYCIFLWHLQYIYIYRSQQHMELNNTENKILKRTYWWISMLTHSIYSLSSRHATMLCHTQTANLVQFWFWLLIYGLTLWSTNSPLVLLTSLIQITHDLLSKAHFIQLTMTQGLVNVTLHAQLIQGFINSEIQNNSKFFTYSN